MHKSKQDRLLFFFLKMKDTKDESITTGLWLFIPPCATKPALKPRFRVPYTSHTHGTPPQTNSSALLHRRGSRPSYGAATMPAEKREAGENEPERHGELRSPGAAFTASLSCGPRSPGTGQRRGGRSSGSRRTAAAARGRQGRRHVRAASDPAHFRSRRSRRCHGSAPLKGPRGRGARGVWPPPVRGQRWRGGGGRGGKQNTRLNSGISRKETVIHPPHSVARRGKP